MRRYAIHLAYNGANYCGWQRQPALPTVQETLEEGLGTLLRLPVPVMGCGRTDSGVHASDFYAHFDSESELPENLTFKLNSYLPPDIAIYGIQEVAADFHARFSALSRTYEYRLSTARLPFLQGLYCRIYFEADVEKMNEGARLLMEYEDFTSFAKLHTDNKTNLCTLREAGWRREGELLVFRITANRFLRNMVRSVTGTLLDVGRGKLSLEGLREIVERKDRCAAGVSMPAQGLFLTHVEYPWDKYTLNS
ncbi:MAG: tRNA pseudouridine(38-40) synthase TruA [Bacteroidales bacterium]|nr:tRNA pseudouridine(38-40) synthase TruA [Bacteroidales bacterium]